jgi:hypothetical protein
MVRRLGVRADHEFLHTVVADLEDLGFAVINPNDRVKMVHGFLSLCWPTYYHKAVR